MKLLVPKGACDTHIHVYDGQTSARPGTPNPGRFTVAMYREVQRKLGLERVIVVQPNAYADDNRVTLDAIGELGKNAKGVGVVRPGVADAELERLTKGGICALRIMTLHGGTLGFEVMDELMARVHFEDRRSQIRGCREAGQGAGKARAGAPAVGEQLAAPVGTSQRARRRGAHRAPAGLGARRAHAQHDPGRQPRGAVRVLEECG